MDGKLRPTRENVDDADEKQCDFTLLTQIVEARAHPAMPETVPRVGAGVPSIDASDPLGGRSGPVYREHMQIAFALFRPRHHEPAVDTHVFGAGFRQCLRLILGEHGPSCKPG